MNSQKSKITFSEKSTALKNLRAQTEHIYEIFYTVVRF
ncbi:hypothetical protein LEP1GSC171_2317 [Leptospira santarosai str. HAI1380]|nr:hypothetical protein LEP1GSC005_2102 [Leptospira santarosai str. ST188]EMP02628.1 hypothetical protein LEP1GSC171_2317 [Leptospira santarosai str. HAI1380]